MVSFRLKTSGVAPKEYRVSHVLPLLNEPNILFHRKIRDASDHEERLKFSSAFPVNQVLEIAPSAVYPGTNLISAMMRGAVTVSTTGGPGKRYITYREQYLSADDGKRLEKAVAENKIGPNQSVLYMAQLCYERLLGFFTRAEMDGRI